MNFKLHAAASHMLRLLYPPRCACCNRVVAHNERLCATCADKLPRIEGRLCGACGRAAELCGENHRFEFVQCIAPFYYLEPVRQGIHGLKFEGRKSACAYFGVEMADAVRKRLAGIAFDLVTCVPLSHKRERERGYNQASLLARQTAEFLRLPFEPQALSKLYDNKPQHRLSRAERRGNVLGVYEADAQRIQGKRILLVDDIETTGSTLNECAKMLKLRGADVVYALVACITLRRRDAAKLRGRETAGDEVENELDDWA